MGPRGGSGAESGSGEGPVTFQMRTNLVDNRRDFWVETLTGRTVYKVDAKILPGRDSFTVRAAAGEVVAHMQARVPRTPDTITIHRPGRPSATITRARVTADPIGDRYVVQADDVGEIAVRGDVLEREYTFELENQKIAQVSKGWTPLPSTFGVLVESGVDVVLVLVATAALDALTD